MPKKFPSVDTGGTAAAATIALATAIALSFAAAARKRKGEQLTKNSNNRRPDSTPSSATKEEQERNRLVLKAELRSLLSEHNGCTKQKDVVQVIEQLAALNPVPKDCSKPVVVVDDDGNNNAKDLFQGEFFTLSAPPFPGRIKSKTNSDNPPPQFTLGRMSFNIFQPNNLVCTLKSIHNPVFACTAEKGKSNDGCKFTYDVVIDITIHTTTSTNNIDNNDDESNGGGTATTGDVVVETDTDLEAIMINTGFCTPSPDVNNRMMVTFTGSSLVPKKNTNGNDANSNGANNTAEKMKALLWTKQFANAYRKADNERSYVGWMVHYGLQWFLGLAYPTDTDERSFRFEMKKPKSFYLDVVYLDEDVRITKGSRGTIVVADRKK